MKLRSTALGAIVALALLSGCAMCRNPFDYCSPVIPEGGCPNCEFGARQGSVFAPPSGSPQTAAVDPTPAGTPEEVTGELDDAGLDSDPGTDGRVPSDKGRRLE